jgi:uncharacterized membrane protein
MKSTVFRYGIYASLAILALGMINFFIVSKNAGYGTQEVAGYLTMLLSTIFIFQGIRHYRDKFKGGLLSFGDGLKIGLLIALVPAIFFGLFDLLYTEVINPSWKEDYYNHYVQQIKDSTPADKLAAKLEKVEKEKELFGQPAMQFLIMAGTVFVIGAIVTIISALALRRTRKAVV